MQTIQGFRWFIGGDRNPYLFFTGPLGCLLMASTVTGGQYPFSVPFLPHASRGGYEAALMLVRGRLCYQGFVLHILMTEPTPT